MVISKIYTDNKIKMPLLPITVSESLENNNWEGKHKTDYS